MKIQDAEKNGFKLFDDGRWRKFKHQIKNGKQYEVWQPYLTKICLKCGELFLASHDSSNYCSRSCSASCQPKGENSYCWKGGIHRRISDTGNTWINGHGYVEVYLPSNQMANKNGYVGQHRLVMSEHIGRPIEKTEHVHHINGDRSDNRIENLVLLTKSIHNSIHKKEQVKNFKRDDTGKFTHL